jgi:hypothetical protein
MDADVSTIEFLSFGDLVGQAVRLCWRNIPMILQVLLVPAIGCMLGRICMHWPLTVFNTSSSLFGTQGSVPNFTLLAIAMVSALLGLIIWFYSVWIMMLRLFALVKLFVAEGEPAEDKTFPTAYRKIKTVQWAILGVFTLGTFVSLVVTCIWFVLIVLTSLAVRLHVIPSWILASCVLAEMLAMIVSVILLSIIYWLAYNDIVLEGDHVKPAILRAWLLAWPNFWRIIYFVCLIVLVTILITWPLSLPLMALTVIEAFVKDGQGFDGSNFAAHFSDQLASLGSKVPFYRLVLAQGWETIISMITWPINLFAWAVFYQDLKKRALSLDLLGKLQEFKTKAEAG